MISSIRQEILFEKQDLMDIRMLFLPLQTRCCVMVWKRKKWRKTIALVNIVTFPIHGAGLKMDEMASVLGEMDIGINKVCFDHTTVKDLYDLPKAELTITDYPMVWTRLMKERFSVDHYEMMLLRDVGMKAGAIIHKTQVLEGLLSREAIEELINTTLEWARRYGSDPDIIVNPTFEEEIKLIKETGTDLVIVPSLISAAY